MRILRCRRWCLWSLLPYMTKMMDWFEVVAKLVLWAKNLPPNVHWRMKHVYMDNCSTHNPIPWLLRFFGRLRKTLSFLSPNTSHLVQPKISEGAPFIENQKSRAFTTYSINPLYIRFFGYKSKQYMYKCNDKNTSDNMYT